MPEPALTCGSLAAVFRTRAIMSETFGCSFAIWMLDGDQWQCVDPGTDNIDSSQSSKLFCWFTQHIVGSTNPQTALVDGQLFIATTVNHSEWSECVLVARLTSDVATMAANTAKLAMREADQTNRLVEKEELVEHYSQRLSDSFEELSFLRKLSKHVEHCVADRDLSSTAASILPQLRSLLMVEGLVLVEAGQRGETTFARRVLGSSGTATVDEKQWLSFIDEFGTANRRVLVRNYGTGLYSGDAPWPGLRSIVLAPVQKTGYLYGWLIGANKQAVTDSRLSPANSLGHDEIGSMEASLLEAAALMLGTHAGNNRLFQEKESLIVDVIHTLVGVIEARDRYTCGHSDRVALIGRRLAYALGLPSHECHDVFLSGLLHDIGKIGVSDRVLLKPGELTQDEYEQIKVHPERGARLLRGLRPLERLIPGVLHHHEAFDGTGYPHALKGEQIPLMARILAVADAYDAMTSDRPYRGGMPAQRAESILLAGSGKQWDASVIEAFFSVRDDVAKICQHWQRHLEQLLNPAMGANSEADYERTRASAEQLGGWQNSAYADLPSFVRDVESMLMEVR